MTVETKKSLEALDKALGKWVDREGFRGSLRDRINEERGDINRIAAALEIAPNTLSRWLNETGYALPDVWQVARMAQFKGVSWPWLAFDLGPRSKEDAEVGLLLSETFYKNPGLAQLAMLYMKSTEADRNLILQLAGKCADKLRKIEINADTREIAIESPLPDPRLVASKLREEPAPYPRQNFRVVSGPPVHEVTPQDTGPAAPVYKLSFEPRDGFKPARHIEDLAAGYGVPDGSFESIGEAYVQGKDMKSHGFTVAKVRGNSMLTYLEDGEHILLKDFPTEKRLPRINKKAQKMSLAAWQRETQIYNNDIVVVDLGIGQGTTLKRVHYDTTRGLDKWKMQIVANNPPEWREAFQIETGDEPVFYAKLMARLEPA